MSQHLWFRNLLEGLVVRGLGPSLTDELRGALARIGVDVTDLEPAYDVPTMVRLLAVLGPLVGPSLPPDEQQRLLGMRAVEGPFHTLLGHALAQVLRVVGPARGIDRLERSLRSVTNSLHVRVVTREARAAEVDVEPVGPLAHFVVGIFQGAALLQARPGQTSATLLGLEGERCRLRLSW